MMHLKIQNIGKQDIELIHGEAKRFMESKLCSLLAQEITQRVNDLRLSDTDASEKIGGINAYLDMDALIRGGILNHFRSLLANGDDSPTTEEANQKAELAKQAKRDELRKAVRAEN